MKSERVNNYPSNITRIGITGATSGLGRRLCEIIIENNFPLTALVRRGSDISGLSPKIDFFYGDIRNYNIISSFVSKLDVCIHLAALTGNYSKRNFFDVNVTGMKNICQALLNVNRNCHLIYCSTISVLKINPLCKLKSSLYAVSKYMAEKYLVRYMKHGQLRATIVYPGLMYGKYDRSFIPRVLEAVKKRRIMFIKGGEKNAPLVHVDEICDLIRKIITSNNSIGKRYVAVKGIDLGIHDVVGIIASNQNITLSQKKLPKLPLLILSILNEWFYKYFKKGKMPSFNRTAVDIMSINFKDYKKKYDDPYLELGWKQNTSREYFLQKLDEILISKNVSE